jgi:predicted nucleotidyltransferase
LFGSALRDDFGPESDYDFLVSFQPDAQVDFFDVGGLQYELEQLMGRDVDLVEKEALRNPYRKAAILESYRVIYAGEG